MAHERGTGSPFPPRPVDRLTQPIERFLHVEAASGVVLLAAALLALVLANSPLSGGFLAIWKTPIGVSFGDFRMEHSLKHWINDGLMVLFFFVIGLEVKRELVLGELHDVRKAALPIAGALGGMLVPALVYLLLAPAGPARAGWGIPMATDIAFVVGCTAVLGRRVPHGLRVFLLSLAIADDIGAILVIAIGYTAGIDWGALGLALLGLVVAMLVRKLGVRSFGLYALLGAGIWLGFHESGVHATVAGVILGLLTPTTALFSPTRVGELVDESRRVLSAEEGPGPSPKKAARARDLSRVAVEAVSPLEYLEARLHPWMGFVVMPVFALANAGVPFHLGDLADPVALAVGLGLLVGKPVGILLLALLAVRLGLARLPEGVTWSQVAGGGVLAGIGFTMALFIAGLALGGSELDVAKVGILAASSVAAALGTGWLHLVLPRGGARVDPA